MSEPQQIGPYRLERLVSTGATAQVWFATGPNGPVALKVARADANRASLRREADAVVKVAHARVVRLLDRDPDGGWLALQRVQGLTAERWSDGRTVADVVAMLAPIADALAELARRGVVHGDLKPKNIVVDAQDRAFLIDFGAATSEGDAAGGFRGTPGFVSPEVTRGERATPATDAHGFGGLLYACLTGKPPYVAADAAALAYLPIGSLPVPPQSLRHDLPAGIGAKVLTLLARDPARRPTDLVAAIREIAALASAPPGEVVFGMEEVRATLRRSVVAALDGESRVVVVYGPPGVGRRTLMGEAVDAGRREGLQLLKDNDPQAITALERTRQPSILAMRVLQEGAIPLAKATIEKKLPLLLLLHADRPMSFLGAQLVRVTPPPLGRDEARALLQHVRRDLTDAECESLWKAAFGHPGSLLAQLRKRRRVEHDGMIKLDHEIPGPSRRVLQALRKAGEVTVPDLARSLDLSEHELLDLCEVLFAEGLVGPAQDGFAIALTDLGRQGDGA